MKKKNTILSVALMMATSLTAQTKQWTLQECIDYAMQHNITLQRAKLQLQSAKEDVSQSKAALLPSLNASTSHNLGYRPWQDAGITTVTNGTLNTKVEKMSYNGSYGLNASWTVWNGNRNHNQVKLNQLKNPSRIIYLRPMFQACKILILMIHFLKLSHRYFLKFLFVYSKI